MASITTFRGILASNIFSLLFSAGQGCLIPFLSLYFLYIGMTPFQTGLLLGLKGFTAGFSGLFWTQCIANSGRRLKCILIFSLTFLVSSHLIMVLMPIMNPVNLKSFCHTNTTSTPDIFDETAASTYLNDRSSHPSFNEYNFSIDAHDANLNSSKSIDSKFTTNFRTPSSSESSIISPTLSLTQPKQTSSSHTTKEESKDDLKSFTKNPFPTSSTFSQSNGNEYGDNGNVKNRKINNMNGNDQEVIGDKKIKYYDGKKNEDKGKDEKGYNSQNDIKNKDYKRSAKFSQLREKEKSDEMNRHDILNSSSSPSSSSPSSSSPSFSSSSPTKSSPLLSSQSSSSSTSSLKSVSTLLPSVSSNHLSSLERLTSIESQLFGAMVVLVVISEIFSSPCKPTADELYIDSLDSTDHVLSRRRSIDHWSLLGASTTPWILSLIIDHLPCHLSPFHFHKLLTHFWIFGLLHLLTILSSLCLPVRRSERDKKSKASKTRGSLRNGLRLICSDGRTLLCGCTVFMVGVVQGVVSTFLPWRLHEIVTDSKEITIGASIGIAAFGELLSHLFGSWFASKLGHTTCIFFGLLVNSGRLLLYGFLPNPWLALLGESMTIFGAALVYVAVSNHPVFQTIFVSRLMKEKKKKKKSSTYHMQITQASDVSSVSLSLGLLRVGMGSSVGCILAGILLENYGFELMFWVGAAFMGVWSVVFLMVYPCCKNRCARNMQVRSSMGPSLLNRRSRERRGSVEEEDDDYEEEEEDETGYDNDDDDVSEDDWLQSVMRKEQT